jgi:hypothetical protein
LKKRIFDKILHFGKQIATKKKTIHEALDEIEETLLTMIHQGLFR